MRPVLLITGAVVSAAPAPTVIVPEFFIGTVKARFPLRASTTPSF
jgi:hypothetical protein